MKQKIYSVCVRPAARKSVCTPGKIWVKDRYHEFYVGMRDRGEWGTIKEAQQAISEPFEIVVEVVKWLDHE